MSQRPQFRILCGGWHLLCQNMAFGNPTAGGASTMEEALRQVAALNRELVNDYGVEIAVSGHLWHEIAVPMDSSIARSAIYNNRRAITLDRWMAGVDNCELAPIGRIIPPGFGLPDSDFGAFINPSLAVRQLAHDAMVYAFAQSYRVKETGTGLGDVIYWTGPDGIRWSRIVDGEDPYLSYDNNPRLEEWKMIIDGVGQAVKVAREQGYIDEKLLIEGKSAGDPCYLDVFTDTYLECQGINAINAIIGADVAEWQGELCHTRGAGEKFAHGLKTAIKKGVFGGRIHLNAGGIASQSFTNHLTANDGIGTPMSLFQQYVDNDFLPGQGPREWLEDQQETLRIGAEWSAQTGQPFEVEFDARFSRYEDTIGALKRSTIWTINELKKYNAVPV